MKLLCCVATLQELGMYRIVVSDYSTEYEYEYE